MNEAQRRARGGRLDDEDVQVVGSCVHGKLLQGLSVQRRELRREGDPAAVSESLPRLPLELSFRERFIMFAWLYDIKLDPSGIRFVLFRVLTIHVLKFDNIKSVTEIGPASIGCITAYNFKSRFLARSFMIETRHGRFTRKVLVTPKSPNTFIDWLREHEVPIT